MGESVVNRHLVTQRKPLERVVPSRLERWLVRKYFQWRGFACRSHVCTNEDGGHDTSKTIDCAKCGSPVVVLCDGKCYASIEYRGTFDDPAEARWAASCPGGSVVEIPHNFALPEETVTYRGMDVPLSEASAFYRRGVRLPFIAIRREEIDSQLADLKTIDGRLSKLNDCIEGTCART